MTAVPTAEQWRLADLLHECYGRYLRAAGRSARDSDWLADADYILEQLPAAPTGPESRTDAAVGR